MRIVLIIISIFFSSFLFAQATNVASTKSDSTIMHTFIQQLANPDVAVDIIISQQIIVEEPSDELYDYLEVSLEEIRLNLVSRNIEEITYVPFKKAPRKETKDIDLEDLNPEKVYLLYYKNKQILALYIEHESIGSFTLVAKGNGKAHFVLY